MSEQHTPGRLTLGDEYDDQWAIAGAPPANWPRAKYAVAVGIRNAEDARRLVACWNACEGLSTEALERSDVIAAMQADRRGVATRYLDALDQRDQLMASLKKLLSLEVFTDPDVRLSTDEVDAIKEAERTIATVTGSAS